MSEDFAVRHNPEARRFEVDLGGPVALADYNRLAHAIMFTHTEVPPQFEGRGIGTRLIVAGLDYARAEKLKVIPTCPFFAAYMRKHGEVQDLLDPTQRKLIGLQ